jgi:hypothetical protein
MFHQITKTILLIYLYGYTQPNCFLKNSKHFASYTSFLDPDFKFVVKLIIQSEQKKIHIKYGFKNGNMSQTQ